MLCLIKYSKFQAVERLEMCYRDGWLYSETVAVKWDGNRMRFCGIINIYVDSFKLLKLSVVIESKNEATAAFQNSVLCSLLLCRRVLEL